MLSLRVRDFRPDDQGGAHLALPLDGADLKTGPRTIYVVESVATLKLWVAVHPNRYDPDAPLFPSRTDTKRRMFNTSVTHFLARAAAKAGVRHVHPHLFRHTRATRAARNGWNEPQLRAYFEWTANSNMASRYVHLSQRDMQDRVRADLAAAAPKPVPSIDDLATTIALALVKAQQLGPK